MPLPELSVVAWKWKPALPSGPRYFGSSHVNVLRAMVERHLPIPHRFICVTDDTDGLDSRIEALPLPPQRFDEIAAQPERSYIRRRGQRWGSTKYFPSCYRRLWMFSEEAKSLGERILALDVDVIVTGSLLPVIDRPESFVGWCDESNAAPRVAGGVFLLTTGAHTDVWTDFDPSRSPELAREAGYKGSDQAWMSLKLKDIGGRWGRSNGLTKLTWLKHEPDESTRLVFTAGHSPPWDRSVQKRWPWVSKHWK